MYKFLVTFAILFSYCQAQNIDIDILKSINPSNPNSGFVKSISSSVYPLSLATPLSILAVGIFNKNERKLIWTVIFLGQKKGSTGAPEGIRWKLGCLVGDNFFINDQGKDFLKISKKV